MFPDAFENALGEAEFGIQPKARVDGQRASPYTRCLLPGKSCVLGCFNLLRVEIDHKRSCVCGTHLRFQHLEARGRIRIQGCLGYGACWSTAWANREFKDRAGKVAQLVKSLSCKHEDLGSAQESMLKRAKCSGICLKSQQWGGRDRQMDSLTT